MTIFWAAIENSLLEIGTCGGDIGQVGGIGLEALSAVLVQASLEPKAPYEHSLRTSK